MENPLVIGLLNIVEDKLRQFDIMLPDDDREDSTDPIVGYQYAELHDLMQEYLEDAGILSDPYNRAQTSPPLLPVKVYGLSVVNTGGLMSGFETHSEVFTDQHACLDAAYKLYSENWKELKDGEDLDHTDSNGTPKLSKMAFQNELMTNGAVTIQLEDYHISFERFERDLDISKVVIYPWERNHQTAPKEKSSLASVIQSADSRRSESEQKPLNTMNNLDHSH